MHNLFIFRRDFFLNLSPERSARRRNCTPISSRHCVNIAVLAAQVFSNTNTAACAGPLIWSQVPFGLQISFMYNAFGYFATVWRIRFINDVSDCRKKIDRLKRRLRRACFVVVKKDEKETLKHLETERRNTSIQHETLHWNTLDRLETLWITSKRRETERWNVLKLNEAKRRNTLKNPEPKSNNFDVIRLLISMPVVLAILINYRSAFAYCVLIPIGWRWMT